MVDVTRAQFGQFGQQRCRTGHRLFGAVCAAQQLCLHLQQPVIDRGTIAPRQLAAFRMHRLRLGSIDLCQKDRAVAFQLFGTNPGDPCHLVQGARAAFGHFDQGAVGKDHIGGHPRRLCQRPATGLELRQQRFIFGMHQRLGFWSRRYRLQGIAAQFNRLFAAQDWPRRLGHPQGTVAFRVWPHQIAAHHLAKHRAPHLFRQVAASGKGGQPFVPPLPDLFGGGTGQNVDQMACAKVFTGAQNGRQRLAYRVGRIKQVHRAVAQVAVAAGLCDFTKIAEQDLPATLHRLCQPQQRVQPCMIGGLAVRRGHAFINLAAAQADVFGAIQRQGFSGGTIAARPADFLIIAFDRFRQIGMGDPADVGFVDPHAKSHGGHHDQPVFALKPCFGNPPFLRLHPGVIGAGLMPLTPQRMRQRLGLGAGAAIDNPRLPAPRLGKGQNLVTRIVFHLKRQMDVGPVKTAQKGGGRITVEQPVDDFATGFLVRGGGKGRQRYTQRPADCADLQIIGAEIMAPLADAMRLIHRDQRGVDPPQQSHGCHRPQPFRRHVQQFQPAVIQRLKDFFGLGVGIARGQRPRLYPGFPQSPHLIAHQGDQRGNHQCHPVTT